MHTLINMFWLADVMNLPFMEMFDTAYPLNGLFWFLTFLICYTPNYVKIISERK